MFLFSVNLLRLICSLQYSRPPLHISISVQIEIFLILFLFSICTILSMYFCEKIHLRIYYTFSFADCQEFFSKNLKLFFSSLSASSFPYLKLIEKPLHFKRICVILIIIVILWGFRLFSESAPVRRKKTYEIL